MHLPLNRAGIVAACVILSGVVAATPASAVPAIYAIDPFETVSGGTFLYQLNADTGVATQVGMTGRTQIMGIAFDTGGRLLGVNVSGQLFELDPDTGAAGPTLTQFPSSYLEGDIAVDPTTNTLYVAAEHRLHAVNLQTYAMTELGGLQYQGAPIGSDTNIDGIAFRGGDLYGLVTIQAEDLNNHLIRIDKSTLNVTDVGDTATVFGATAGLGYDAAEDVFYAAGRSNPSLHRLDPATGAGVSIGSHGLPYISALTVIPEPSAALALLPLAALLATRRRSRRSA